MLKLKSIVKAAVRPNRWIEITDIEGSVRLLHNVWLRDNCPCSICRHPLTDERLLFSADIPRDISPESAVIDEQGDLNVVWNDVDGVHVSSYKGDWIADSTRDFLHGAVVSPKSRLWRKESFALTSLDWKTLMNDEDVVLEWCDTMIREGVAAIVGVPGVDGEVERVASRIAHVRETAYDRLHNVRSEPTAYNVASTDVELKTHTDMPNYAMPPGVQLLHFVQNETSGGETTLTDGFAVAADLMEQQPEAFRVLCETSVGFRMSSKKADIIRGSKLITLDGNGVLDIVRFSNQLQLPLRLSPEKLDAFYDAYREYSRRMISPEYMVEFRADAGTIIATHNHRVLHGRARFDPTSGARHLQLSYLDFDDVLSRARILRQRAIAA